MSILDIFNQDAFSMMSMSAAIDKVDTVPNEIGSRGIFVANPIREKKFAVESRQGSLSLIQTSQRGAPLENKGPDKRQVRYFETVRVGKSSTIYADELQFLRGFGMEQQTVMVAEEISRRLSGPNGILADLEATWENMRLGAIQGIVADADASVIYNYFTEFNITQEAEIAFDLANTVDGALREKIKKEVVRKMRRAAKGLVYSGVDAYCGDDFFDALIKNAEVRATYLQHAAASDLRSEYGESFSFGGVNWINYQGTDDNSTVAVAADKVKFTPAGPTGAFEMALSPGETLSEVGSLGRQYYAMIEPEQRSEPRFVTIEVYSYPLFLAKRPDMLLRGRSGA